jgi:hypothetical protein
LNIPQSLIAGDTWSWTASYGDYPAGTWTATAYFENAAESFNVVATADGTDHSFDALATATDDYKAGSYFVQVRVTAGAESFVVESGWCEVTADPASGVAVDHRSWARRTLDAVEAFIEGNATTAQQSMSIAGRSISRWSLSELMQFRSQLRGEVRVEEQGESAGLGRDIKVRYGRPS